MFNSIRWKFIIVYFLLVFIAMMIVGVFIVENFRSYHINQTSNLMEDTIEKILYSTAMQQEDWEQGKESIQRTIGNWPLGSNQNLYVISNSDVPEIIASNLSDIVGQSAFDNKEVNSKLLLDSLKGDKKEIILEVDKEEYIKRFKHIAYPVYNNMGNVKGIVYIIADLTYVDNTILQSQKILTKATLLALVITVLLGFFIARSVTEPINDVTIKAEKMAKGDFNQVVQVKSNDEIGQLASMFNYLTQKLKKTISEVYKEKSKMETIFNYMADGVVAVNTDGDIIHANPIALNMLKLTDEQMQNKKYDDIFKGLNEKITLSYLKKKKNWEGSEIIELDTATYRARYAPFKNDKDEVGGLIIVFQDITEQHKLENMRKEFVANVSHELKTPITTIKSYTETLLGGALDSKELSEQFLKVINSESDRMARIVRDLLQLSNLDYKQTKWKKVSLSIKDLLEEIKLKMEIAAKEKKQTIEILIEPDIPNVVADKDGIEQVILNIISNAIKYTPDKGHIKVNARTEEDNVIITVQDNGIGIPEGDLDRIFERFYRVDKARSRALGGTGLGLSIAKQIVESHNGHIKIRSEYNVGTEVDVILPIEQLCVIQS